MGGIKYTSFINKHLKVEKADYEKIQPIYVDTDRKLISFWSGGKLWDYKLESIKEHTPTDGLGGKEGWFTSARVFRTKIHPNHLETVKSLIK